MECKDNQITDAILSSNQKRLDNAIYVATQERTRYFAERIARTELARAYHDGVTARWDNDPDCVAYQWRMSQSHPVTDICDLYAGADLYGMGAGVFPKGKVPELPAHPHCMCYLRPLMSGSLKLKSETPVERVNKGGKEWLDKQSKTARQNILGVMGEMQYKKGGNWQAFARGYGTRYMKSRLANDSTGDKIKLTEAELQALNEYISSGSYKINEKLRNSIALTKEEALFVKNLDSALGKLPSYQGTVYRSIDNTFMTDEKRFNFEHQPGSIISYAGYTSSGKEVYDESFKYQMVIKSKRGVDLAGFNDMEKEVLFKRGTFFRVFKRDKDIIYLEEL